MGGLLRKEWREHRWVLLAMLVLLALCQAIMLRAAGTMGSPMVAFQKVVAALTPIIALVLANRLVVREYMGRTQLFLETLPVGRAQVLATKWLFGCWRRWPPAWAPPRWPRAATWRSRRTTSDWSPCAPPPTWCSCTRSLLRSA